MYNFPNSWPSVNEFEAFMSTLTTYLDKGPEQDLEPLKALAARLTDHYDESQEESYTALIKALADASRNEKWRKPLGDVGLVGSFNTFLRTSSSSAAAMQGLRAIGNCVADCDENRGRCLQGDCRHLVEHLNNPDLRVTNVSLLFNLCADYEPAQTQLKNLGLLKKLLELLISQDLPANSTEASTAIELLSWLCDSGPNDNEFDLPSLIRLCSAYTHWDDYRYLAGICAILLQAKSNDNLNANLAELVESIFTFLEQTTKRRCMLAKGEKEYQGQAQGSHRGGSPLASDDEDVEELEDLDFWQKYEEEPKLKEDVEEATALCNSFIDVLCDISHNGRFAKLYPVTTLTHDDRLVSWLVHNEPELKICACLLLGNLAISEESCRYFVQNLDLHVILLHILNSSQDPKLLYAVAGFLRHLAVPNGASKNREIMGSQGVLEACLKVLANTESEPVKLEVTHLLRLLVAKSSYNVKRLITRQAFLSKTPLLAEAVRAIKSTTTKIEFGRMVVAILRTVEQAKDFDDADRKRLFSIEGLSGPVLTLVKDGDSPVAKTEGWLGLALAAKNKEGAVVVAETIQHDIELVEQTIKAGEGEKSPMEAKANRDNALLMVHELTKNAPEYPLREKLRTLLE